MKSSKDKKRLSKFLALMLRHEPERCGLTPDSEGFVSVASVWEQIVRRYGDTYTYDDLGTAVEGNQAGKKRYEIRGGRIRALYGHSKATVVYEPVEPPNLLYHGTTASAVDFIRRDGLTAQSRQYVHMTTNRCLAVTVGTRHEGWTIVLSIRAGEAYRSGIVFYHPEPEHYLSKQIPSSFIDFL
jgi:putative RNA 2'-phosphotransferase